MGYNTTLVILNDGLEDIKHDSLFGRRVAHAISQVSATGAAVDISAGRHANVARVIETHHADRTAVVTVGGNLGLVQHIQSGWTHHDPLFQTQLLERWAHKLGFRLEPIPKS